MSDHANHPIAAGKSSYDLVDADKLFDELDLQPGQVFLDLACGRGLYSLHLARKTGTALTIHALDLWQEGISQLREDIEQQHIVTIQSAVADASQPLPLAEQSVDTCLLAAVLHDFKAEGSHLAVLSQVQRVLRPGGQLAVLEFQVQEGPPGPPKAIRLGYEAVVDMLAPFGFSLVEKKAMGPHLYLALFTVK